MYKYDEILDVKGVGNQKRYLVRWSGFPISESTWEPASSFPEAPEIEFKAKTEEMAKSSKKHRRSSARKVSRSSSSPARTTTSRKTSRSRSRSRSTRSTPRSRSSSRNRRAGTPKKPTVVSQAVKKFNDFTSDFKKSTPSYRSSDNYYKNSYYQSYSDAALRRRGGGVISRVLQPLHPSNLKVKGMRLKRRLGVHYRRHSCFYNSLVLLSLVALGFSCAGYTTDHAIRYVRSRVNMITSYIKKRR